jgi:hypothetical protein
LLAALLAPAVHAQPIGKPPRNPFVRVERRIAALEAQIASLRGSIGDIEKALTPLDGLQRCVRVIEGELAGLPGPHLLFTRCNVHVRSGELATDGPVNGLGNLIVGYNEGRCSAIDEVGPSPDPSFLVPCLSDRECGGGTCDFGERTGSHNLVIGQQHEYSSYAGIVGGRANALAAPEAGVTAGHTNRAEGRFSAVHGGVGNRSIGPASTVTGGRLNATHGAHSIVAGGLENDATGSHAAVLGGESNEASGRGSAVVAGRLNEAEGVCSAVVAGGHLRFPRLVPAGNVATGDYSAILGGQMNRTGRLSAQDGPGIAATVAGGVNVNASGYTSSVSGGEANIARGTASVVGGGFLRSAHGEHDWRAGGLSEDE